MEIELYYYRNNSGMVAVSADEGDTIIVPTGNVLPPSAAWEEVQEDLRSELNAVQEASVKRFIENYDDSPVAGVVRKFARNRAIQERLDGIEHERVYRKLPADVLVVVAEFD